MRFFALVVEGESPQRSSMETTLLRGGYNCHCEPTLRGARRFLHGRDVDVVLLDSELAHGCARRSLWGGAATVVEIPLLVLTESPGVVCPFRDKEDGGCEFLPKSSLPMRLLSVIKKLLAGRKPRRDRRGPSFEWDAGPPLDRIRGESSAIKQVRHQIEVLAKTDVSVLIIGETGTGKELVAEAIHRMSRRAKGPWVPVNCGRLTDTLADEELFGHEKGAFTGAVAAKPGLFELADGGTLFLDEISDMTAAVQPKLLRVLDDGSLRRVGARRDRRVDVRIVAATNADLDAAIRSGRFRRDLFYRLWGDAITLPPLKDRDWDVVLLARYFLERSCRELRVPLLRLSPRAEQFLLLQPWSGNVRELERLIQRTVLFSDQDEITVDELQEGLLAVASVGQSPMAWSRPMSAEAEARRRKALAALDEAGGDKSEAARRLGIARSTLYLWLGE